MFMGNLDPCHNRPGGDAGDELVSAGRGGGEMVPARTLREGHPVDGKAGTSTRLVVQGNTDFIVLQPNQVSEAERTLAGVRARMLAVFADVSIPDTRGTLVRRVVVFVPHRDGEKSQRTLTSAQVIVTNGRGRLQDVLSDPNLTVIS